MKIKNHNYFSEFSLQSIYWAGFIAARGFIHKDYPYVQLKVRLSKEERLIKFLQHIQSPDTIITTCYKKTTPTSKQPYQKRIVIKSEQWVTSLKTLYNLPTIQTNIYTPNLTQETHIQTFLLGYLDAGAYLGYRPISKNRDIFTISISGHPIFCNWIHTYIDIWFPSKLTSTPSVKSTNSAIYSINGKRAFSLYSLLSKLPVDKSTKWLIDYKNIDSIAS